MLHPSIYTILTLSLLQNFLDASSHLYMRLCPSVCRSVGRSVCRFVGPCVTRFFQTLKMTHWGSPTLTLLNVLGVLGVLNVLCVLHVLHTLHTLHVLNMLIDALLACWALFYIILGIFSS